MVYPNYLQRSPAAGQWRHRRVGHVDVDVDEGVGREVEAVLVGHQTVDDGVGAAIADEELGVLGVGEGAAVVVMSLPAGSLHGGGVSGEALVVVIQYAYLSLSFNFKTGFN